MAILTVDFGATRTRVGWFSEDLELLSRAETLSQSHEAPAVVIERIIDLARRVIPNSDTPAVIGISAGCPQAYTGLIVHANTLPGWHQVPLARLLSQAFHNAPAHMENDANLAALAEYHAGAAQGADPALYLTVSTGIGGGAIIGGQLFTGWRKLAIEPGHIRFPLPNGELRSLEALASGTAIGRLAREHLALSDQPSILRIVGVVDGKSVGEAAAQGDALAREVIDTAGRWLGLGLVCLTHLFNPRVIVIGGSVANLGELIFAPARQILMDQLIDPAFYAPDLLRPALLGDDVCLIGAARYARDQWWAGRL